MKKTRTIKREQTYIICDMCESEGIIGKCGLCGKDVCHVHGQIFNVLPYQRTHGFIVNWSPDRYELTLCNECQLVKLTTKEYVEKFGATKNIKYIRVTPV